MKKWITVTVLGTVMVAVIIHFLIVSQTPYIAMDKAMEKLDTEINTLDHSGPPDEDFREVVRPSPDLLYSTCIYDVNEEALLFTVPVTDTYWSISGYAEDTHNFFSLNHEEVETNTARVLVVGEKEKAYPEVEEDMIIVEAPSDTGIILIRIFVSDREKLEELKQIQERATVETFNLD